MQEVEGGTFWRDSAMDCEVAFTQCFLTVDHLHCIRWPWQKTAPRVSLADTHLSMLSAVFRGHFVGLIPLYDCAFLPVSASGLGPEYFRTLLQSNCGVSVLDFTPDLASGAGSPSTLVSLNRLNQVGIGPLSLEPRPLNPRLEPEALKP